MCSGERQWAGVARTLVPSRMSLYLPMTSRFLMTRFLAASFAMWRNTTQPSRSRVAARRGRFQRTTSPYTGGGAADNFGAALQLNAKTCGALQSAVFSAFRLLLCKNGLCALRPARVLGRARTFWRAGVRAIAVAHRSSVPDPQNLALHPPPRQSLQTNSAGI